MKSKKIEYPCVHTIVNCEQNLREGNIGIIEYHLHKDNTWIGYPFTSAEDKKTKLNELKEQGYQYDKITYFAQELERLKNLQK